MNRFSIHIKNNFLAYILAVFFAYLFFYHIDYSTLASWDEAWYASIARAMARSGDYLHMIWNGKPYYDHPPMGFWIMAITYKMFGINELTTRLPSAIMGYASVMLMYATGIRLFGKKVIGAAAAVVLGTSVWYVLRVRSGNLDSVFVFFYILTVYLSVRSSKDMRWIPAASAAFAGLLLSKTLVGASASVLVLYQLYPQIIKIRKSWRYLVSGLAVLLAILMPWYVSSYTTYPDFMRHHFFEIGTRDKSFASYFHIMPSQPLFYIHMGMRKWYYLWILGFAGLLVSLRFLRLPYLFIILWNAVILYPFLTSEQTQLWHLIPVYIPIAFVAAAGIYELEHSIAGLVQTYVLRVWKKQKRIKELASNASLLGAVYLLAFAYIAAVQVKIFHTEVMPVARYEPDDVGIARHAASYGKKIYLDDDFFPIAVYYSDQKIYPLYDLGSFGEDPAKNTLVNLFKSGEKGFVAITRNWAVNNLVVEKIPYKLLEKNGSFSIVTTP